MKSATTGNRPLGTQDVTPRGVFLPQVVRLQAIGVQREMSPITAIRRLWEAFVSRLGAEEYSLLLALVVIVGLTAITAMRP